MHDIWHIYVLKQLYLTKYHISTAQSNSDGGHFELQNGGYTQIIYIVMYTFIIQHYMSGQKKIKSKLSFSWEIDRNIA